MFAWKKTIGLLSLFLISNSVISAENEIVYQFKSDSFVLKKECVASMLPASSEYPDVRVLKIALVNDDHCAKKLNSLIGENIGSDMSTYFNDVLLNKSYIAGPLKVELGYRMTLGDDDNINAILSSYK